MKWGEFFEPVPWGLLREADTENHFWHIYLTLHLSTIEGSYRNCKGMDLRFNQTYFMLWFSPQARKIRQVWTGSPGFHTFSIKLKELFNCLSLYFDFFCLHSAEGGYRVFAWGAARFSQNRLNFELSSLYTIFQITTISGIRRNKIFFQVLFPICRFK